MDKNGNNAEGRSYSLKYRDSKGREHGEIKLESDAATGVTRTIEFTPTPRQTGDGGGSNAQEEKYFFLKYGDLVTPDRQGPLDLTSWQTGRSVERDRRSGHLSVVASGADGPIDVRFHPKRVNIGDGWCKYEQDGEQTKQPAYRKKLDALVSKDSLDTPIRVNMKPNRVWVFLWENLHAHYVSEKWYSAAWAAFFSGISKPCGHAAIAIKYESIQPKENCNRFEYIRLYHRESDSLVQSICSSEGAYFIPSYLPHSAFENSGGGPVGKRWHNQSELAVSRRHADYCIELDLRHNRIKDILNGYDAYRDLDQNGFWERIRRFWIERNTSTFSHYILSMGDYEKTLESPNRSWGKALGRFFWNALPVFVFLCLGFYFYDATFERQPVREGEAGASYFGGAMLRTLTILVVFLMWEGVKSYAKLLHFAIWPSALHNTLLDAAKRHGQRNPSKVGMAATSYIFNHSFYLQAEPVASKGAGHHENDANGDELVFESHTECNFLPGPASELATPPKIGLSLSKALSTQIISKVSCPLPVGGDTFPTYRKTLNGILVADQFYDSHNFVTMRDNSVRIFLWSESISEDFCPSFFEFWLGFLYPCMQVGAQHTAMTIKGRDAQGNARFEHVSMYSSRVFEDHSECCLADTPFFLMGYSRSKEKNGDTAEAKAARWKLQGDLDRFGKHADFVIDIFCSEDQVKKMITAYDAIRSHSSALRYAAVPLFCQSRYNCNSLVCDILHAGNYETQIRTTAFQAFCFDVGKTLREGVPLFLVMLLTTWFYDAVLSPGPDEGSEEQDALRVFLVALFRVFGGAGLSLVWTIFKLAMRGSYVSVVPVAFQNELIAAAARMTAPSVQLVHTGETLDQTWYIRSNTS